MPSTPLFSACVEWLNDWTQTLEFPIVDTYDLAAWMEEEGCEALQFFVEHAFRKPATRTDALEILRALLWEWFVWKRETHLQSIALKPEDATKTAAAVTRLLALPQTAQKTAAWHAESRNLLTGHEFAHVVYGTPVAFQAAVARKCGVEAVIDPEDVIESRTVYVSPLSPFQWGWRYESVIRDLYQTCVCAGGRVDDTLGRIRHPTLPRLAASPDGLICEGEKAGRLLEIKAPVSRELNGELPRDYYCQIQLQAEVTDAEAVEYVEIRFDARDANTLLTAEERQAFLTGARGSPGPFGHLCGAVLVLAPYEDAQADTWTYAYSPFFDATEEGCKGALTWLPEGITEQTRVLERSVWRVKDAWTTTVPRNRRWWSEVGQPAYERFWVAVDDARATGRYAATCLVVDEEVEDAEGAEEGEENVGDME
jgi:hypothetical protein